ncbi:leucyl aminopeptidase [Marinomonas mediterranea]|jgi:aminopeptidase A. Metallo peptidase. MEROPS family M17|uniref:Probable cytosol aminopeptidase n=1 Tax=Marinomonas mediterranea (strain ATCC 700492 / JCM 21426 / NBRC 103028 / MMB-1) TaxID=717774 RepID=F2JV54_MARM1|nr:leucyl aminopeptidase [Marinomonas mediterranea]ADZ92812.1 cytosol aminopeptidase [Marinomonas mediterranea MMB-1]WCN18835.1 leucyl aminopeptidase [Marinomonas mediterranea MMB-1]
MNTALFDRISAVEADLSVVFVPSEGELPESTAWVDAKSSGQILQLRESEVFKGSVAQTLLLPSISEEFASAVLLVGIGKDALSDAKAKKVIAAVSSQIKGLPFAKVAVALSGLTIVDREAANVLTLAAQWLNEGFYEFIGFKQDDKEKVTKVETLLLEGSDESAMSIGVATAAGSAFTRQLGNLPGNVCTPSYLASKAQELGEDYGIDVELVDETKMDELGMHCMLSVGRGSDQPSYLIVMHYRGGAENEAPHVLLGKGITFDTGGISLKPGAKMDEMKYDMCGAASVFGTMKAICELKPALNFTAVIAAAENMPSGHATKPGDVVRTMSGKTVEVLNTDAEGRLVLCDALTYIERFEPQSVVDIATLTGACIVALGSVNSGMYSNSDVVAESLKSASKGAADKLWQMPLDEEYQQQLDSNFADIGNIGGPEAGSVTAACFLSRFTDAYPWAHLDIAGTAWTGGAAKGASGRPVGLLTQYLLSKVS